MEGTRFLCQSSAVPFWSGRYLLRAWGLRGCHPPIPFPDTNASEGLRLAMWPSAVGSFLVDHRLSGEVGRRRGLNHGVIFISIMEWEMMV